MNRSGGGRRPLLVTIRCYRCAGCAHVWRQDASSAAEPGAKLSRRGLRWVLEGIVVAHLMVARVAEGLGVSWNTANNVVLAEGKRMFIDDPNRFDGVKVIGVDEHVWRHTRRGDKYVTVIIDLTPIGRAPVRHGCSIWSTAAPNRLFSNGWPIGHKNGVMVWKSLPWTDFPGLRPPPPKNCPTR